MKTKVLVLCHDTVGAKMAGPGIRYQNIADQIKRVADVSLGIFSSDNEPSPSAGMQYVNTTGDGFQALFDQHNIIFAQWLSNNMLKYAVASGKTIIIDLYAPVPVEHLASLEFSTKKISPVRDPEFTGLLETYKEYLAIGDYLVCSNERQRDFWLGFMTSANIITPSNFNTTLKMDKLALCPMGISSTPPSNKTLKLRQRAGIDKDDFVLLWTGGIWDWFDAKVVIRAVKQLNNPKIKLVFMGTQHPNTKVYKEEMSESQAARELAEELKLTGKSVFFLDGWVDYEDRASYLMDADVAIYADKDSIETRFSHRTRVLDHIWVGLPTICSKGDYLSEVLANKGMGIAVDSRTPEDFAKAIKKAYDNPALLKQIRANIARERHSFTWEESTSGLLNFIRNSKPKNRKLINQAPASPASRSKNYRSKAMHRVKGSIKVLIGRIDV